MLPDERLESGAAPASARSQGRDPRADGALLHSVKHNDTESIVAMFCETGTFEMPDRVVRGHDELRRAYTAVASDLEAMPFIQNHVINVNGDQAEGLCAVQIRVVENGEAHTAAGHYEDTYRRVNGEWLFDRRFLTIYHWVRLTEGWAGVDTGAPPPFDGS